MRKLSWPELERPQARPCMAIIGNGPIRTDLSEFIDACDLVLRFNECKNYGIHSGRKIDILCINNTGAPAQRIVDGRMIRSASYYDSISEVWFPRNAEIHKKYAQAVEPPSPLIEFVDWTDELIVSNELAAVTTQRFSGEFYGMVFHKLKNKTPEPFVSPSTGFLAIEYVLSEPRFSEYEIILIGFSFQGWRGHPWKAEHRILQGYASGRPNFRIIPPAKMPFYRKGNMAALKSWLKENVYLSWVD